jgi:MFS family permease
MSVGINPMAIMSRSILSELLTPETRIKAFSLFTPSYVVGLMVGNILGGLLAKPGGKFGRMVILQRWPFVLPSLFCGVMCVGISTHLTSSSVAALFASSVFLGKVRAPEANLTSR